MRPYWRSRPRRRPVAHPLPQAVLQRGTTHLARPVGAQRLAELCDYRSVAAGDILDRAEVWQLAARVGVGEMEWEVCADGENVIDLSAQTTEELMRQQEVHPGIYERI